jgi:hypothetical protein
MATIIYTQFYSIAYPQTTTSIGHLHNKVQKLENNEIYTGCSSCYKIKD